MGDRLTFLGHRPSWSTSMACECPPIRCWATLRSPSAVRCLLCPLTLVDLSAVFISHGHLDHLDLKSLRALPGEPALIVPVGLGRVVAKAARGAVHEMRAGDQLQVGDLTLEAVHAEHSRRRSLFTAAEGPLGILIVGSTRVYFAGDTGLFPGMRQLAGRVDVALLPVSGWGPTLGRGHLDPQQAAEAAVVSAPRSRRPSTGDAHRSACDAWRAASSRGPGEAFRERSRHATLELRCAFCGRGNRCPWTGGSRDDAQIARGLRRWPAACSTSTGSRLA